MRAPSEAMTENRRTIEGYEFPDGLWYHAREHLWLRPDPPDERGRREVIVGVDAVGVEALGEVVYLQLHDPGRTVERGQAIGSVEAEKMVRPLIAPVSGTLGAVNAELLAAPRLLNADPYGRGWLVKLHALAWETESKDLLSHPDSVEAWVRAELRAHEERS